MHVISAYAGTTKNAQTNLAAFRFRRTLCNLAMRMTVRPFVQQVTIQSPSKPGGPVIVTQVLPGTPRSPQELSALNSRREELFAQLERSKVERRDLVREVLALQPKDRHLIEGRIADVDTRISRLERDYNATNELIASAPASAYQTQTTTEVDPDRIAQAVMDEIVPLTAILSVFVLLPITLAFVRFIWRRSSGPSQAALADQALTSKRLEQIQQSIDTIAVEVERISEGQRYAAKVMDRALGAGAAEPVAASEKAPSYGSRP